jgi:hypothetical protein
VTFLRRWWRIRKLFSGDARVAREEATAYATWKARGGPEPLLARVARVLEIPEAEVVAAVNEQLRG